MKLLHTSDWHLGRMLHGRSLLDDQEYFLFRWLTPLIDREKPDCVIVSGDVFDRKVPPVEAIELLERAVDEFVVRRGLPLLMVAGNHDGAQRMALSPGLLRKAGLFLATCEQDALSPVVLQDGSGPVEFFLLPWLARPQPAEGETAPGEAEHLRKTIGELRQRASPEARHVLCAHLYAAGSALSESEGVFSLGGGSQIAPDAFAAFDYAALGHIHMAQRVGVNGGYSGSPLAYAFGERGQKSVSMVTLSASGAEARRIPVEPMRAMRSIEGDFAALLAQAEEAPCGDYLSVRLTGRTPVFEPVARLRAYYPNLLSLSGGWTEEQAERAGLRQGLRAGALSGGEVFGAFFEQVCGEAPEQADRKLFERLFERAGKDGMEP